MLSSTQFMSELMIKVGSKWEMARVRGGEGVRVGGQGEGGWGWEGQGEGG